MEARAKVSDAVWVGVVWVVDVVDVVVEVGV